VRTSCVFLASAIALLTSACAPSLPALIAAGRYDEAICASDDGTHPRHDDPSLILAIEAILRPTVQLHAVTPEEIDRVFADATPELKARAREASKRLFLVQRHIESQPVHVNNATAYLKIKYAGNWLNDVGSEEKLAALLNEKIPSSHEEAPGTLDTVVAWGKDVSEHPVANFLTLGIWSALNGPSPTSHTIYPTKEDYQRLAPITIGLLHAYPGRSCDERAGAVCDATNFHERPEDEGNAPISVELTVHADSSVEGGIFTAYRKCSANRTVIVELPAGGTIEERMALLFGDKTRSFAEAESLNRRAAPEP
jgi:hypothetical protein